MKRAQRPWGFLTILILCLLALPLPPLSANAPTGTVVVWMPADAYTAADIPAMRALPYGSFVWLELTAEAFAQLQASGRPYQVQPDPFTLTLGEQRFDPGRGDPELPAGWQSVPGNGPDLYLLQLVGPTDAEWLAGLRQSGLEIVQYIHPFTYVVWGDAATLERAGAADYVRWTGPFAPAYRVLPQWRDLPDAPLSVNVMLVRMADIDAALQALSTLGGESTGRAAIDATFEIANFTISGAQLQAAARVPGVYSIQPEPTDGGLRGEMSNQINVNNHDGNNQAYPGYLDWLAAAGVNGAGVIIANVDGGIQDDHTDLVNRIIPCTGQTCGGSASSSHGTHTAGIMAADGSSGVLDPYGFLRGLGMAPGANLVEQVYNPWFTQPGGMLLLMTDSYNNGASLSGNSWGPSGSPLGYDDDTRQVDVGVRDADPDTPGNQPLSYILSFMNGNGGYQTQGTPDEAKNIFTIGSTKMQTSGGSQILEINDLSANTAHGPALDGRTIPHMVAPGCYVDSTVPTNSYGTMCGTSMASPHTSGAVALFIEYYRNLFGVDPSPALIKAAHLPVAHDLAGYLDADGGILGHPFDAKQGWGRMDTAAVVSSTVAVEYFDNPVLFDNTGEEWVQTMAAADPAKPVRLMLVWTDAPGHGLGGSTPAWNNDLDLVVEADGNTYYGNNFGSEGWSQPGGSADGMNNTEGVFLGPTFDGALTVHVVASNINSDGVPNYGDDTDQDLSLVCYNCVLGADFNLRAEPSALSVCTPEIVTSTIQVEQLLDYSEPVTLTVLNVPAGVTTTIAPTVVTPPGAATLTLEVGPATADGDYTLVISGTAEITNVHTADLKMVVSSGPPAAPTLLSPPNGATGQPLEPTLTWGPLPQVTDYGLQLDILPTFPAPVVDVADLPTGTYTLDTPLQPATCYYWRAMGENACGPGDWAVPFNFATVRFAQVFADDVESGGGNWTATGLWHITTAGVDPCAEAHSGNSSWYYGQESACDYDVGSNNGTLTLAAPVDLSTALAPATLRFWSWEQTEDYGGYDTRKVYLSSNGSTWTEAWNSSNNASAWYQVELDVSSYVSGDLYIRFEFDTVDSSYNTYRGWYVDDIEVIAGLPSAIPPTVLSVIPDQGWSYEETPVVISGSGFAGTPAVKLGETWLLTPTLVSSTTLEAVVPAGLPGGVYDLTLYNGDDCQAAFLPDAFTVLSQCITPTGELTSDSPVMLGEGMHFTATVTGTSPLSYTWDFGGPGSGSGLDGPTPVYTYTDPGIFTVTLSVENRCGALALTETVQVQCEPPQGGFISDSPVTLGETMHFTATITGTTPLSYTWDFGGPGNGGGLDGPAPVYTYTDPGGFTVTLTVENPCGMLMLTETVQVLCDLPQGGFTSSSPVTLGEAMHFTASVTGTTPLSYTWDFGGPGSGSGMDGPTPVYTYTDSGAFTVTLSVENPCGTMPFTELVIVRPPTVYHTIYLPIVVKDSTP